MNKYIQAFLDDNNLKVNEEFKLDSSSRTYYFSGDGNLKYTLPSDGYHYFAHNLVELLNGDYKVKKLSNIPTEKFIPKENEKYWFVSQYSNIVCNRYDNDKEDDYILTHNHIFQTKAEADDYKWFLDKVDEYKKPFVVDECNCYLYFDFCGNSIRIGSYITVNTQGTIHFGNEGNIKAFIKEVGEERIKKYMFDIWG